MEKLKHTKTNEILNEIKISRVWQHFNNKDIPVAIINAFNTGLSKEENKKRNTQLAKEIFDKKYGHFYVDGFWTYESGPKQGEKEPEDSIVVVGTAKKENEFLEDLKNWSSPEKYNQEGFIYKPVGSVNVKLVYSNGKIDDKGIFHANKIGKAYSQLKNRKETFLFENAFRKPNINWFVMVAKASNLLEILD